MAANMPPGAHGLPPDWDEDRRPALTGALILFIVLTVIAVIARITLQLTAHRRLYWDDLFIGLAMVPTLGLIACDMFGVYEKYSTPITSVKTYLGMSKGLGLHITRVMASDPRPPGIFITLWKVGFTNSLCIYLALFCIKMSLLWLYRRLFWIARWCKSGCVGICFLFRMLISCSSHRMVCKSSVCIMHRRGRRVHRYMSGAPKSMDGLPASTLTVKTVHASVLCMGAYVSAGSHTAARRPRNIWPLH